MCDEYLCLYMSCVVSMMGKEGRLWYKTAIVDFEEEWCLMITALNLSVVDYCTREDSNYCCFRVYLGHPCVFWLLPIYRPWLPLQAQVLIPQACPPMDQVLYQVLLQALHHHLIIRTPRKHPPCYQDPKPQHSTPIGTATKPLTSTASSSS